MSISIIKTPVITEKSSQLAAKKVYSFVVDKTANKYSVANSVEKMFNVKVDTVKIINRKGKEKRVGKKMLYKQMPNKKIALVYIANGTIDLFPQP